jgi:hypothetical protein
MRRDATSPGATCAPHTRGVPLQTLTPAVQKQGRRKGREGDHEGDRRDHSPNHLVRLVPATAGGPQ